MGVILWRFKSSPEHLKIQRGHTSYRLRVLCSECRSFPLNELTHTLLHEIVESKKQKLPLTNVLSGGVPPSLSGWLLPHLFLSLLPFPFPMLTRY